MTTVARIFAKDVSVWTQDEEVGSKIANRLGWLEAVAFSRQHQAEIEQFASNVRARGFTQVLLLGMGGSCLAAEVFDRLRPQGAEGLSLHVLDSTCPEQIIATQKQLDLASTLVIVASKSGGTLETRLLFEYFYEQIQSFSGEAVGRQFVAITDQGSQLQSWADERQFLHCFVNPSDIGGRFSALSYFGLVPAVLAGWSLDKLLARAEHAVAECRDESGFGVHLGHWLVQGYNRESRLDKLLLQVPDSLQPMVWWIEQLVAESLGKLGEGIFPVLAPSSGELAELSSVFAKTLTLSFGSGGAQFDTDQLASCDLSDEYDIAAQFFHWEVAVALAGASIGINPFDEPNVSEAKQKTAELLQNPASIVLPEQESSLHELLERATDDSYIAVLAYWPINSENDQALAKLRQGIEQISGKPVSINYGPRYLHSTGQLHKGGRRQGVFLVLAQQQPEPLPVPGEPWGFETVCRAQSIGDYQALIDKDLPALYVASETLDSLSLL